MMRWDLMLVLSAFVAATILALVLGASNLGRAFTFGQMACAAAAVYVIVKRP
jgi:hypothetical protein